MHFSSPKGEKKQKKRSLLFSVFAIRFVSIRFDCIYRKYLYRMFVYILNGRWDDTERFILQTILENKTTRFTNTLAVNTEMIIISMGSGWMESYVRVLFWFLYLHIPGSMIPIPFGQDNYCFHKCRVDLLIEGRYVFTYGFFILCVGVLFWNRNMVC